jgi:hypothetical protein
MQILIELMLSLIGLMLSLIDVALLPISLLAACLVGYAWLARRSRRRSKNLMPIEKSMHGLQITVRYSTGTHHNRSHGSE